MKKIILFIVVALCATTQNYAQCACCAGAGSGSSNGDYSNGILTLSKNQLIVEAYNDYRTIRNGDAQLEEETLLKSMVASSLGIRYGLNNKMTVSALLPYVFLNTASGNDSGLGDLVLMGTYTIHSKNNFNIALQAGVELPTGIQKNSNFDNTTIVVGSGSFDPMAGILISNHWDKFTLMGSGLFKYTTSGFENNYYGSIAIQNLTISYKIKDGGSFCTMDTLDKREASNLGWTIFGGYYGEWLDQLKEDTIPDENSGYYLGFANLGTNLSYKNWSLPLTLSLPIVTNMNGNQNDAGFRLRIGILKSF